MFNDLFCIYFEIFPPIEVINFNIDKENEIKIILFVVAILFHIER